MVSNLFTLDAIADIALSERLGLIESGNDLVKGNIGHEVQGLNLIDSLHCGSRAVSRFIGVTDWFHLLKALYKILSPHFRTHADDSRKIVSALTDRRMDRYHQGTKLDDFLSYLVEDKAGKQRDLYRGEIEAKTSILYK